MIINLDFTNKEHPKAKIIKPSVAIIARGKKNKIAFSTGIHRFYTQEAKDLFIKTIIDGLEDHKLEVEVYDIDLMGNKEPDPDARKPRDKFFCPFCGGIEKFASSESGYKLCPICGISDMEYGVRKHNNLWVMGKK